MIIKLKKFLVYGIKEQMDAFFEAAQEQGFMEFIGKSKKIKTYSKDVKDIIDAVKILKKQPYQQPITEKTCAKALVSQILHIAQSLERLYEEEKLLEAEIMRVAPFGVFSKEDIIYLENNIHRYFQFFTVKRPKKNKEKFSVPDDLIYINSFYDLDYYIGINHERKSYSKMLEVFIETPLDLLHERKLIIEKEILQFQKELKNFAGYLPFLMKELNASINIFSLEHAKSEVSYPIEDSIFIIQAWVPENKLEKLKILLKNFSVNSEEIAIEKTDRIPTYLENNETAKVGEDLINIYDVPSVNDKDPSMWVLISFAIFFAVIVGDLGYGLIFLILSCFLKFKYKIAKPFIKRFTKLSMILSITCIIWGFFLGSFFGYGPSLDSPLGKVVLINNIVIKKADYHVQKKDDVYLTWIKQIPEMKNAKNGKEFLEKGFNIEKGKKSFVVINAFQNNILMETAILIGILHIGLSFLRYLNKNYSGIGWIMFMIGGYLFLPGYLKATSIVNFLNILDKNTASFIGKIFLFSGFSLAVLMAFVQKKLNGAMEITNMVTIFADVMSYMRLYALGLAGMIMAGSFNDMGAAMGGILGVIIIILGHLVNITSSIMGGVIHGLRLNFIEWYHYSFEGDGKLFNPLKLLK